MGVCWPVWIVFSGCWPLALEAQSSRECRWTRISRTTLWMRAVVPRPQCERSSNNRQGQLLQSEIVWRKWLPGGANQLAGSSFP